MTSFGLVCNKNGLIKEIIGCAPHYIKKNQLFTANPALLDFQKALNFLVEIKANGIASNWELTHIEDGTNVNYQYSGLFYDDEIILVVENSEEFIIEDLNRINIELSELVKKTSIEERKKSREFMETASHELRTPNTVISGYIELVLENYHNSIPSEAYKWLQVVMENAKRLEKITTGLLELEKMENEGITPRKTWLSLKSIVNDVIQETKQVSSEKCHQIFIQLQTDEVYYDQEMLHFILKTLIENAIKFSDAEEKIVVTSESVEDNHLISVMDNGIGIPREYLSHVFTPFFYIPKPKYYQGIGISLSLCKGYVEANGGEIWVESSDGGNGSVFQFTVLSP